MPRVTPEILVWARESAGMDPDEAARRIGLRAARGVEAADRLLAMERGDVDPTRAQVARMAHAYRRPLVAFYLAEPPRAGERGRDFRTATVPPPEAEQAWLDALIRELHARHALIRAALDEEEEVAPLEFIGATSLDEGVDAVMGRMRDLLAFERATFREAPSVADAFSYLRERVEGCGVFALLVGDLGSHHTAISPETFRGYALADPVAPMIVVNDRDARSAWSFTLLHEFCHLLLGESGVSGGFAGLRIERFCNEAASRLLLDEGELQGLQVRGRELAAAAAAIGSFARQRNLSRSMIAYRLFRAGLIPERQWQELTTAFKLDWLARRERTRAEARHQAGGPSYYVVRRHRLGPALLETVNYLLKSGGVSVVKAGLILGVKPTNVGETLAGHVALPS